MKLAKKKGNAAMRQTALLFGLLLLAACGPSDQQKTVYLQQQRLHALLADEEQAGAVTVQNQPDGAEVVFPDATQHRYPDAPTNMVQSLIDPSLLRIGIAAPAGLSPYQTIGRTQAWIDGLKDMQVGDAELGPPPQAVPGAMAVTLQVICPHRHDGAGYGDGTRKPACY
jgi:hypothetical protein